MAHVDPVSLGVLEAPGAYGCALAIGEGQSAGNYQSYGGPHYGFLAARSEFIRRMPGRISGETRDSEGKRGFVLTLQTREQHIRREKATSNITTNQTLLALAGLVHLSWLGPQGLRELGETCLALSRYAKERLSEAGLELVFPNQATFKEFAVHVGRPAKDATRAARAVGVHPGYAIGRDYAGLDDALLVALCTKSRNRGAGPRRCRGPRFPPRRCRKSFAVRARPGSRRSPSRSSSGTSPPSLTAPSASTPGSTRLGRAR